MRNLWYALLVVLVVELFRCGKVAVMNPWMTMIALILAFVLLQLIDLALWKRPSPKELAELRQVILNHANETGVHFGEVSTKGMPRAWWRPAHAWCKALIAKALRRS